jgi:hypothetical protein
MFMHITLAAGLLAIAADPASTTYSPRTLPPAFAQAQQVGVDHVHGTSYFHGEGHTAGQPGCSSCGGRHDCCGPYSFRCHFLFSPCDMSLHMPYWNRERGYYYFRPYHVVHVLQQQEKTASWGGNVQNPYDNRFLDKIHDEWEADYELRQKAQELEDLPNVPGLTPMELEEPQTSESEPIDPQPSITPPPSPAPAAPEAPEGDGAARKSSLKKFVTFR